MGLNAALQQEIAIATPSTDDLVGRQLGQIRSPLRAASG